MSYFVMFRMAPEVILCETIKDSPYDFKADIWSFGLCFNRPTSHFYLKEVQTKLMLFI